MWKAFFFFLFVVSSVAELMGQNGKDKKESESNERIPTSVDPGAPQREYAPKMKKKKRKSGVTYDARAEFEERMEQNWKDREKDEKILRNERSVDKSQPPYFGHRRPPKIKPLKKRKLCKVCGIIH